MDKKISIKFDDTETEEYEFHQYKSPILINDVDINEIVVSICFGTQDFKYSNGYKDKLDLYAYFFPEMSTYKRYSDKTKCMYFMIKDKTIFDKYVAIWEKVSSI